MIFQDTTFLEEAKNSLSELDKLISDQKREQNSSLSFHSTLMLSAHNIKHLNKIDELESDCVMINLEDGVAKELKPMALRLAAIFISNIRRSEKKIVVRVNPLGEGAEEEIKLLNGIYPDAIRVPKIRTKEDVQRVLELVDSQIEVHLSIETKEAWLNLKELKVDERVKVFYLGILDLFAELNLAQSLITPRNETLKYILSEFLVTSLAIGVKPVSFVYQNYKNESEFSEYLELEKSMGFSAKACIAPIQVKAVNRYFKDNEEALERAIEIVALFEAQEKEGNTGFVDEKYGFIDEPIYKDALNVLKR